VLRAGAVAAQFRWDAARGSPVALAGDGGGGVWKWGPGRGGVLGGVGEGGASGVGVGGGRCQKPVVRSPDHRCIGRVRLSEANSKRVIFEKLISHLGCFCQHIRTNLLLRSRRDVALNCQHTVFCSLPGHANIRTNRKIFRLTYCSAKGARQIYI